MFYGSKFENDTIIIETGTKSELETKGMQVFDSELSARLSAERIEYRTLRREFNAMTLDKLDSDRARELEKRIWGKHESWNENDYYPGKIIENRKAKLKSNI